MACGLLWLARLRMICRTVEHRNELVTSTETKICCRVLPWTGGNIGFHQLRWATVKFLVVPCRRDMTVSYMLLTY